MVWPKIGAMAAALARYGESRLRNAHQQIYLHRLCQSKSLNPLSLPITESCALHSNGSVLSPSSDFPFSPNEQHLAGTPLSFAPKYLFSTSANAEEESRNPKVLEEANTEESEKFKESHKGSDAGKLARGGYVSWLSFLLLVITGAGLILYYDKEKKRRIEAINKSSLDVKEGPSAGKAAIGGPFNLINHDGKHVTEKDFMGKWTLIYFGFTHCPDVCPEELQKLAVTIDKIKEKAGLEIIPLFISVDPERDTVEQVREYVKEFHPKLIGLTGSLDEAKKVARAFRVYYMKSEEEEDADYLVDHSIVMYLMDPSMEFVKFFGKNHDADSLADNVIQEIKAHKLSK